MEDRKKVVNKRANLWHKALQGGLKDHDGCHAEPQPDPQSRDGVTPAEAGVHFPIDSRFRGNDRIGIEARHSVLFPPLSEINVTELNDAQKAAYVWLVTAAFWDRLRKQVDPERLLPLDGEEVAENPGAALRKVTDFFGLPLEEERLKQILADPVLSHHAKFPGQTYDAAKRRDDRADWETRFGADADRAMAWAAPIQEQMEADGVDFSIMAGAGCKELVA